MRFSKVLAAGAATILTGQIGTTAPMDQSVRPSERPEAATDERLAFAGDMIRPQARPLVDPATSAAIETAGEADFQRWISDFRDRARAAGIGSDVLERAFRGVVYDPKVVELDRNQSEFTKTIWEYLGSAASETRIANGKRALEKHRDTLEQIEARYGVDKDVVVAIWGLESAYGSFRGSNDVIRSMATLAFDGRRGAFFEEQLIAALRILQSGDTEPRNMTGSWAGAMGHTQFMPTSYLEHAVDFDGDGRRNLWSDDPSDALASTAAYLAGFGWVKGQPWGVEVQLPDGFDYTLADRKILKDPSDWAALGVVDMQGQKVPNHGKASVLLPAGSKGAAFMIFKNFEVIERYNTADAYVIGVGHLSDRIMGGPAIQGDWPLEDRALTFDERQEMQRRLTSRGFSTKGIDGKIGPKTIAAVRAFQQAEGLTPDGYASLRLLNLLR